jgi:hypothetical protein
VQNRESCALFALPRLKPPPFVIAVTAQWCNFIPSEPGKHRKLFDFSPIQRNFDEIEQDSMGRAPTGQKVDERSSSKRET